MSVSGWIGVDLDGTLAEYHGWDAGKIGLPIPAMLARVKAWLDDGVDVRIFTARVAVPGPNLTGNGRADDDIRQDWQDAFNRDVIEPIEAWCIAFIGRKLPITNKKDFAMVELWDDRCVQVEANTGRRMDGKP